MKGRYCPDKGMDDVQNYLCKAGYLCLEGLRTATPNRVTDSSGSIIGDLCSNGKHCPG